MNIVQILKEILTFILSISFFLILGLWMFLIYIDTRARLSVPKISNYFKKENSNYYHLNKLMLNTDNFRNSPFLSIIIPARNEHENIEKCIRSLLDQNYPDFEIIVLDDNSTDDTLERVRKINQELLSSTSSDMIIKTNRILKIVSLKGKPDNWTGKTWASEQGFIHSQGDILLFTDADTKYISKDTLALTVDYLLKENLDVLTGKSYIELIDPLSKIVMPLWTVFDIIFGRNPSKMNDPESREAYLLGAFIMIRKEVLRKMDGFTSVKNAIQEDKALGEISKERKYKVRIIEIDELVKSLWSRGPSSLWHGIERTLAPKIKKNRIEVIKNSMVIFVMSLLPFLMLPYSLWLAIEADLPYNNLTYNSNSFLLLVLNTLICIVIIVSVALKDKKLYRLNPIYSVFVPIASIFILIAYLNSIMKFERKKSMSIQWRARKAIM